MNEFRMRVAVSLVPAVLAAVLCSCNTTVTYPDPELDGAVAVWHHQPTLEQSDHWMWEDPFIESVDDDTVVIGYTTGTCSGVDDAPELPRRVSVSYETDVVTITIDTSVTCAGTAVDIGVARFIGLDLDQPIDGRAVVVAEAS